MSWPILSVTTFLPLLGVLAILLMPGDKQAVAKAARWIALIVTLVDDVSVLAVFGLVLEVDIKVDVGTSQSVGHAQTTSFT